MDVMSGDLRVNRVGYLWLPISFFFFSFSYSHLYRAHFLSSCTDAWCGFWCAQGEIPSPHFLLRYCVTSESAVQIWAVVGYDVNLLTPLFLHPPQ